MNRRWTVTAHCKPGRPKPTSLPEPEHFFFKFFARQHADWLASLVIWQNVNFTVERIHHGD